MILYVLAWLGCALLVALLQLSRPLAIVATVVCGLTVCIVWSVTTWSRPNRTPKAFVVVSRALLLIFGVFASVWLALFYRGLLTDPIGTSHDLGWGAPPCEVTTTSPSERGEDRIIVRRSTCPIGLFSSEEVTYFIFVQHDRQPPSRRNLVFRYVARDDELTEAPSASFLTASILKISVCRECIAAITKQRHALGDVKIEYTFRTRV